MPSRQKVTIGLVQHACNPADSADKTLERTVDLIAEANDRGAQAVATQELFHLSCFPQTENEKWFASAAPIPGPMTDRLGEVAQEHGIFLVAAINRVGIEHELAFWGSSIRRSDRAGYCRSGASMLMPIFFNGLSMAENRKDRVTLRSAI